MKIASAAINADALIVLAALRCRRCLLQPTLIESLRCTDGLSVMAKTAPDADAIRCTGDLKVLSKSVISTIIQMQVVAMKRSSKVEIPTCKLEVQMEA